MREAFEKIMVQRKNGNKINDPDYFHKAARYYEAIAREALEKINE